MKINERLKDLIQAKKIKKSEIAKRLGISRIAVCNKLKTGYWKRLELLESNRVFNKGGKQTCKIIRFR